MKGSKRFFVGVLAVIGIFWYAGTNLARDNKQSATQFLKDAGSKGLDMASKAASEGKSKLR